MKNSELLLNVIGEMDEKLIPELTITMKKKRIGRRIVWIGACAAALIACAMILPKMNRDNSIVSPYDNFPQSDQRSVKPGTDIISSNIDLGEMGFEGLMAYDISELDTPNPWRSDMNLSSLPVYRNLAYTDERIAEYLSESQMLEIAQNTASALQIEIKETSVTYVKDIMQGGASEALLNGVYSVRAKCSDQTEITVYGDGQIQISFENQTLPSNYHFSYNNTSKEEAQRILAYFAGQYSDLLRFDHEVCYSSAERTFSGDEIRSYNIYNKSDDAVQDILNFNLSAASFAPDDDGNLLCIWLNDPLCAAEYLGEYPIITEHEATLQLTSGNYYSSVPQNDLHSGGVSQEDIAKTELVYRSNKEAYFQPYYKYYVELDEKAFQLADGLKNYGIFYVPAVESEYLADYGVGAEAVE